jgi:hypothetical protein
VIIGNNQLIFQKDSNKFNKSISAQRRSTENEVQSIGSGNMGVAWRRHREHREKITENNSCLLTESTEITESSSAESIGGSAGGSAGNNRAMHRGHRAQRDHREMMEPVQRRENNREQQRTTENNRRTTGEQQRTTEDNREQRMWCVV